MREFPEKERDLKATRAKIASCSRFRCKISNVMCAVVAIGVIMLVSNAEVALNLESTHRKIIQFNHTLPEMGQAIKQVVKNDSNETLAKSLAEDERTGTSSHANQSKETIAEYLHDDSVALINEETDRLKFMPAYYGISIEFHHTCSENAVTIDSVREYKAAIRHLCEKGDYDHVMRKHYSFNNLIESVDFDTGNKSLSPDWAPIFEFRRKLVKAQLCESDCADSKVYEYKQHRNSLGWRGLGARLVHSLSGFACSLQETGSQFMIVDARREEKFAWSFTDKKACSFGGHACYFNEIHSCPIESEGKRKDVTRTRGMCKFEEMHKPLDRMRASSELLFFLLQPNAQMLDQFKIVRNSIHFDEAPKPILAMHVRHGKLVDEATYIRFERYLEAAEKMRDLNGAPYRSILLLSDDKGVFEMVADNEDLQKRWTFVALDNPEYVRRGWTMQKFIKADAYLSIIHSHASGCNLGALTILNVFLAAICDGFLGSFNSNLDRMIVRVFEAQTPYEKKTKPIASVDGTFPFSIFPNICILAWPCGSYDPICAPQIRAEFPINVYFERDPQDRPLLRDTFGENKRWWEENEEEFFTIWHRNYHKRFNQALELIGSKNKMKLPEITTFAEISVSNSRMSHETNQILREQFEKAKRIDPCSQESNTSKVVTLEAFPSETSEFEIAHRIAQLLRGTLKETGLEYPCLQLKSEMQKSISLALKKHKMIIFRKPLLDPEFLYVQLPKDAFKWDEFPKSFNHGMAAQLTREFFQPSNFLRRLVMQLVSISHWPHPTRKKNTPLVGMSIPFMICGNGTVPLIEYARILVHVCHKVGATHAFVSSFHHGVDFKWESLFRNTLSEYDVTLVSLEQIETFSTQSTQKIWKSQKFRIFSGLYAMMQVDLFVGNPASPPDWLIYHALLGRQLELNKEPPQALGITCNGLKHFVNNKVE